MLRVLALAERPSQVARLRRRLHRSAGVRFEALVTRSRGPGGWRFWGGLARDLARRGLADLPLLAGMWLRGELRLSSRPLHDPAVLEWIARREPDVGLHAADVIYRVPLLRCFRLGVLNPHIGLLPEYRGRSVMEWAILNGDPTGVTTFFVDEGIDTGPRVVVRKPVDVSGFRSVRSAKEHLFSLDGEMFAEALRRLCTGEPPEPPQPREGRRYYVMSDLFRSVAEQVLAGGSHPGARP